MVRPCAWLVPAFIAAVAVAAAARAQEVVTAAKHLSAPGTVIEAESLAQDAKASAGPVTVQNMQPFGVQWGGGAQLFWRPPAPVDKPIRNWPHLTTSLSAPADGEYSIVLYYTVAPDFGNFRVFLNGEPVKDVTGFAPAVGLRKLELAKTHLQAGSQQLVFTVFSKEPSATDYFVGLDRFEVRRVQVVTGTTASTLPAQTVGSSSRQTQDPAQDAQSRARRTTTPAPTQTTSEANVDRPGADLSSFDLPQADPALCRQACQAEAQCKAFVYVNPGVQGPQARCWLKSSVPAPVQSACCTSGVKILPVVPGSSRRVSDQRGAAGSSTGQGSPLGQPPSRTVQGAVKPGPLGRGEAEGSLNGKKNPEGFPTCSFSGTSKAVAETLKLLDKVFGEFGGKFAMDRWCGSYKREIATGVTLAPPEGPPGVPPKWGLLGGRGNLMADSMMCLLKDLGDAPNGRLTNTATSHVAGRKVEVTQTVGLTEFDPVARSARLYQNVRICAPLLGCLDAQRQTIDATIRESAPAWPSGYKLFDYPIANSYSVELAADWAQAKLGATLPPITIITPYGTISAQPHLDYASRLLPVDTPFAYNGSAKHVFRYPQRPEKPILLLQDHFGRSGVPFTLNAIANLPGAEGEPTVVNGLILPKPGSSTLPSGWVSQVGLGGRDGGLGAKMWTPSGSKQKPPEREDFNMTLARSELEVAPAASIDAGVEIKFKPPNPMELFPSLAGVATLTIEVVVTPSFKANYASQFGLVAREGILAASCGTAEVGSSCGFAETALLSQAHSMGRIEIEGYVYVKVDLIVNPPFVDDFEIKRPFAAIVLDEDSAWKPEPEIKDVESAHKSFAWAGHAASPTPTTALWQGARGFSGMNTGNLEQWTQQCFETKKTLPEPPPPTHDPGDALDVTPDLLPCNLCVASDNPPFAAEGIPVSKMKAGLKTWECKSQKNNGCYDLCSWNKETGEWNQVEQSAAQMFGEKCGGITVK